MNLKITLISILFLNFFSVNAQITPTLLHNNPVNGIQYDDGMDMEIYNNEMYISVTTAGKIVKVNLSAPNSAVVDVVTGLTSPTGLKIIGNELYFLQRNNALEAPSTGKLSKINATLANPSVIDVYSGLMFPFEITANGTNVYVSETYLNGVGELDYMQISLINLSGTPSKTVLSNQFHSVDDFEIKDNFLYIIEWDNVTDKSRIFKLDVTSGTPGTPALYYTDTPDDYFYKGVIHNNYIYLNNDNTPSVVNRIDLNSGTPSTSAAVNGFDFNGNDVNVGEMVADGNNNLYFLCDYYDGSVTTYLLYKVNLNSLSTQDFAKAPKLILHPNPSSDFISFSNLENSAKYQIFSLDGKVIKKGNVNPNETINISHFTTGVYNVILENQSFKFVKK